MVETSKSPIFVEAMRQFWRSRERQMTEQRERGRSDQGFRAAVTGGQQMDAFSNTLADLMVKAGVKNSEIYIGRRLSASHEISVATYDSTVYLNCHLSCRKLRQLFHPGP